MLSYTVDEVSEWIGSECNGGRRLCCGTDAYDVLFAVANHLPLDVLELSDSFAIANHLLLTDTSSIITTSLQSTQL